MKSFDTRFLIRLAALFSALAALFSCDGGMNNTPGGTDPEDPGSDDGVAVSRLVLSETSLQLAPGQTARVTIGFEPADATPIDCYWSSSDESVVVIESSGLFRAVAEGEAVMTARSVERPELNATCTVTVVDPDRPGRVIGPADFGQAGVNTLDEEHAGSVYSYTFGPNVACVGTDVVAQISEFRQLDEQNVSFSFPGEACLASNDVVVFPDCPEFPGGAAYKVDWVNESPASTAYFAHPAAIEEIFQSLHIAQESFDINERVQGVFDEDGNEVPVTRGAAGFEIAIPEMFGGLNSLSFDLGESCSISPKMKVGFTMSLDLDVVDFKVTYTRLRIEATADLACDITLKSVLEKEFKSKRFRIPVGAIPIGPVVITPEIYAEFILKLSGQVDVTFSVSYQKGYFVHALYDGQELHCKAGELKPSDPRDPFAVSGNLSGAVEIGPNIGATLSLYKGALSLGLDFDPHFVFTVFSGYPISLESLKKLGSDTYWLRYAGYEPSLSFKFGGFIEALYAFSYDFKMPDYMGLGYSFGKTYVVPQLNDDFKMVPDRSATTFETSITNKAMYVGDMYMKVIDEARIDQNQPRDRWNWQIVPFTINGTPGDGVSADCNASFQNIQPYHIYDVMGPYMKISLFGQEVEVAMNPSTSSWAGYNGTFYVVDEATEKAVRGILADLYACRDGKWEGCNWDDPNVPFCELTNMDFHYDTDAEFQMYGNQEGYYRKKVHIWLPENWKMGSNLKIANRTEGLTDLGWTLSIPNSSFDKALFDTVEIDDVNLVSAYGGDGDFWPVRNKLSAHSPRLYGEAKIRVDPAYPGITFDLSGSGYEEFYASSGCYNPMSGTIILDGCEKLKYIVLGALAPQNLSFKNCPKLETVSMTEIPSAFSTENYTGQCEGMLIQDCPQVKAVALGEALSCKKLTVFRSTPKSLSVLGAPTLEEMDCRGLSDSDVEIRDCPKLQQVTLSARSTGYDPEWTTASVAVSGCPALEGFFANDALTVSVSNCAALKDVSLMTFHEYDGNAIGAYHGGPLQSWSITNCPRIQSIRLDSKYLGGLLPDLLANYGQCYPRKYDYETYFDDDHLEHVRVARTYSNGYYESGEPGKYVR
jgi:hypothetical protein